MKVCQDSTAESNGIVIEQFVVPKKKICILKSLPSVGRQLYSTVFYCILVLEFCISLHQNILSHEIQITCVLTIMGILNTGTVY